MYANDVPHGPGTERFLSGDFWVGEYAQCFAGRSTIADPSRLHCTLLSQLGEWRAQRAWQTVRRSGRPERGQIRRDFFIIVQLERERERELVQRYR